MKELADVLNIENAKKEDSEKGEKGKTILH